MAESRDGPSLPGFLSAETFNHPKDPLDPEDMPGKWPRDPKGAGKHLRGRSVLAGFLEMMTERAEDAGCHVFEQIN